MLAYLRDHFSTEEIRQICIELGVDFNDLRGSNAQAKARELVIFLERRGRLSELEAYCDGERPLLAVGSDSGRQNHIWELKLSLM